MTRRQAPCTECTGCCVPAQKRARYSHSPQARHHADTYRTYRSSSPNNRARHSRRSASPRRDRSVDRQRRPASPRRTNSSYRTRRSASPRRGYSVNHSNRSASPNHKQSTHYKRRSPSPQESKASASHSKQAKERDRINRPAASTKAERSASQADGKLQSTVTRVGQWKIATSVAAQHYSRDREPHRDDSVDEDERWRASDGQKFDTGKNMKRYVILGTALIRLQIGNFISDEFRAICDTGAQAGLIRAKVAKKNAFPLKPCSQYVHGIGGGGIINKKVQAYILPWFNSDFRVYTELFLSEEYGGHQPWVSLSSIDTPSGTLLADPKFHTPALLDILLAADVWSEIAGSILYRHISGAVMHDTRLGYVIVGKAWIPREAFQDVGIYKAFTAPAISEPPEEEKLDLLLKNFFQAEEVPQITQWSSEEEAVENQFKEDYYRKQCGRYVVKIPLKQNKTLGDSRKIAMRRWFALERKLQNDDELRSKYIEFMREFQTLKHMREAPPLTPGRKANYIPHHALKSKKFRAVFDASCKTSNGESLNSISMIGPKLQPDIQVQLMRFRKPKFAVTTDVVKMYRQVEVDAEQWDLMRIFWRESPDQPLKEYQITVLIYGLANSGFSAVRAMLQCADDHEKDYPEAAEIIRKCFYVDDGLFGEDTIAALKMRCKEVQNLLKLGGFELSKWASNSAATEKYMQGELNEDVELPDDGCQAKILGLRWLKQTDELAIVVKPPIGKINDTKREVLSQIAKLYTK